MQRTVKDFTARLKPSVKLIKSKKMINGYIMPSKLAAIIALSATLTPGIAYSIGFGEISLQSRVGEPLMAEVPIMFSGNEPPIAACFSMVALRDSEFPVVTSGKPSVIRRGQAYFLQIRGSTAISEPIFAVGIRAGCGHDIERSYVVIPEPPIELARDTLIVAPSTPATKLERSSRGLAREDGTPEGISEAQLPDRPVFPKRSPKTRKHAATAQSAGMALPEGGMGEPPAQELRERAEAPPPLSEHGEAKPARPSRPKSAANPRKQALPNATSANSAKDRLLLGAPPETDQPINNGRSGLSSLAETEERILRLETTMHQLSQELDKMGQAIDLATKAVEAQNRLQLAQSIESPPTLAPRINAHPALEHGTSSANWLELVMSAMIGAGVTVGAAQFLSRRRRYPGDNEVPLAFSGYRAEVAPRMPAPTQAALGPANEPAAKPGMEPEDVEPSAFPVPTLPEEVDIPLQPEPALMEAKTADDNSILELAEIMLSFGRLRGATDTLAEYVEETMPDCIEPWSMLLDLYRRGGMRHEFEALAKKIHDRFNTRVPSWEELDTPVYTLRTLEDFPHVIQKAVSLWGSQEGMDYLYSLVRDTRSGIRSGFPLEVVEEIALLMRILAEAYCLQRRHR